MPDLRVVTYNIRHGLGLDDRVDLNRVGEVIRELGADLVGLQEVDRGWRRSGNIDQARYLAGIMDMKYVFAPAISRGPAQYGNAILSRYPILFWESFPLKSMWEPRVLARAVIETSGIRVNFYTTHLGLSRRERMRHINDVVLPAVSKQSRVILTGDFNCGPDSPEIRKLTGVLRDARPPEGQFTFSSANPTKRIDYILYTGSWDAVESRVYSADASDHNPVLTILSWT